MNTVNEIKEYLGLVVYAKKYNTSRQLVRYWIAKGLIPCIKIGGKHFVKDDAPDKGARRISKKSRNITEGK